MSIGFISITLGDARRLAIRNVSLRRLKEYGLEEIEGVEFVDARIPGLLDAKLAESKYKVVGSGAGLHKGELGLWLSNLNALEAFLESDHDYCLVLEDDAVVHQSFETMLPVAMRATPDDMDFFAWAIPDNQKQDYYYHRVFNDHGGWELQSQSRWSLWDSPHYIGSDMVCKAYQGYQAVASMYSREGARNFFDIVTKRGIATPIDLLLFTEHHIGNLNGYTLLPTYVAAIEHQETGSIARSIGMYGDD